jgi:hypothetical protein
VAHSARQSRYAEPYVRVPVYRPKVIGWIHPGIARRHAGYGDIRIDERTFVRLIATGIDCNDR